MNKKIKSDWRDWLANMLGLNPDDRSALTRMLQKLNRKGSFLTDEEMQMIEGVLAIRGVRIRDKMLPMSEVVVMSISDDYQRAVDLVRQYEHSRYPVVGSDSETVCGILLAKDLHKYSGAPDTFRMEEAMREPVFRADSTPLENLLGVFRSTRSHMIVAQNEYNEAIGIITIEDFLEHIVGDIRDESDDDEDDDAVQESDGRFSVRGTLSIEDFNKHFDSALSANGADNIAGWLAAELERMPKKDDRLTAHGFTFQVMEIDGPRVQRVAVQRDADQAQ